MTNYDKSENHLMTQRNKPDELGFIGLILGEIAAGYAGHGVGAAGREAGRPFPYSAGDAGGLATRKTRSASSGASVKPSLKALGMTSVPPDCLTDS